MEKPEDQYRTIRKERKMNAFAYAKANFQPRTARRKSKMRRARLKMPPALRVEPGYARRWIRRNWWRCLASAGWAAAGIGIRAAVAAGRPESWPVGGEIVPMAVCFTLAVLVALGEDGARKRKAGRRENAAADILRQQRGI